MRTEELAAHQVEQFKILLPQMAHFRQVPNWQDENVYQLLVDVFLLGLHLGTEWNR